MKTPTPKQAASQILKLNSTSSKIQDKFKPEYGRDWHKNAMYNKTRQKEINFISTKIEYYTSFLTEDVYNEMLASTMCCDWQEFKN
jgi:hypothetical protein